MWLLAVEGIVFLLVGCLLAVGSCLCWLLVICWLLLKAS